VISPALSGFKKNSVYVQEYEEILDEQVKKNFVDVAYDTHNGK
jgi:hypothetical protein